LQSGTHSHSTLSLSISALITKKTVLKMLQAYEKCYVFNMSYSSAMFTTLYFLLTYEWAQLARVFVPCIGTIFQATSTDEN
jgi:hypothetical protein